MGTAHGQERRQRFAFFFPHSHTLIYFFCILKTVTAEPRPDILAAEPFSDIIGPNKKRKRPKVSLSLPLCIFL